MPLAWRCLLKASSHKKGTNELDNGNGCNVRLRSMKGAFRYLMCERAWGCADGAGRQGRVHRVRGRRPGADGQEHHQGRLQLQRAALHRRQAGAGARERGRQAGRHGLQAGRQPLRGQARGQPGNGPLPPSLPCTFLRSHYYTASRPPSPAILLFILASAAWDIRCGRQTACREAEWPRLDT